MHKSKSLIVVFFILWSIGLSQPVSAQRSNLRVNGTIVGISGRLAGRSRPFSLIINRYTSGAEVDELNAALQRGEEEMLRTLSRMNVGEFRSAPVSASGRTRLSLYHGKTGLA